MDELDKQIAIEKFVKNVAGSVEEIERLLSFLKIEDEKQKEVLEISLSIINKKLKKLKKCETVEETKKHINTKKVIKKYGNT